MNTRERYIEAGHIRPATNRTRADRTVRQSLIDAGKVRPQGMFVDPDAPMHNVMLQFLIRATGRV